MNELLFVYPQPCLSSVSRLDWKKQEQGARSKRLKDIRQWLLLLRQRSTSLNVPGTLHVCFQLLYQSSLNHPSFCTSTQDGPGHTRGVFAHAASSWGTLSPLPLPMLCGCSGPQSPPLSEHREYRTPPPPRGLWNAMSHLLAFLCEISAHHPAPMRM